MAQDPSLRAILGASWLSLLTSSSTLVCCALPALLVAVGAGASLVTLTSQVPQLIWLSEHKALVFGLAAAALAFAGLSQWRARSLPCPVDPAAARACTRARKVSVAVYGVSVLIFLIGGFFAFVLPRLIQGL